MTASAAMAVSVMPAAVAAVMLVDSVASIESLLVVIIVVPPSLMSTINVAPVGAVRTLALTEVTVNAYGALKYPLVVPVVSAVVRSEQETMNSQGSVLLASASYL